MMRITTRILMIFLGLSNIILTVGMFLYPQTMRPFILPLEQKWIQTTTFLGLTVQDLVIHGHETIPLDEILQACPFRKGESIFSVSPEEACEKIKSLPWVAAVHIQRTLPHTVDVQIVERHPLALWEHQGSRRFVDRSGYVFDTATTESQSVLPLMMGEHAPQHAPLFFQIIERYPTLKNLIRMAVYLPSHRWYLVLKSSLYVYLPYDINDGLERLDFLVRHHHLLKRDVRGVDLRVDDKLFFHLPPSAQTQLHPSGSHI